MNSKRLELLSPAKNIEIGIAAINHGADAVYIGAPMYGARKEAGNSVSDIAKLVEYAHKYWAKVYITLNTILYDDELEFAREIAHSVYDAGADALIIQDMGLLEIDLPPIPIFASTQIHNYELDKIKFLEKVGFNRVILARELSLKQIKLIRASTKIDLEFFIHGALCVCFSGRCYLSHATQGRSANRGECAQVCRLPYTLFDERGNVIERNKYLLSLKDLNLSEYIQDLIDAGITSFKIEGRLKDINYVKNVTAFYRKVFDKIIEQSPILQKTSSGKTFIAFQPDPSKTFNRGFTDYFINHRSRDIISIDTPKSIGAYLGEVKKIKSNYFIIDSKEKIHTGDGICFFDSKKELKGTYVNKVEGNKIYTSNIFGLNVGAKIYRNYDYLFNKELKLNKTKRLISIKMILKEVEDGFLLNIKDEDGIEISVRKKCKKQIAKSPDVTESIIKKQLMKLGSTQFICESIKIELEKKYYLSLSYYNELRREAILKLEQERRSKYPKTEVVLAKTEVPYITKELSCFENVSNTKAEEFYKRHGVKSIERALELQKFFKNKALMTTKLCLRFQYNLCSGKNSKNVEDLYLRDNKNLYRLKFDCNQCVMQIFLEA